MIESGLTLDQIESELTQETIISVWRLLFLHKQLHQCNSPDTPAGRRQALAKLINQYIDLVFSFKSYELNALLQYLADHGIIKRIGEQKIGASSTISLPVKEHLSNLHGANQTELDLFLGRLVNNGIAERKNSSGLTPALIKTYLKTQSKKKLEIKVEEKKSTTGTVVLPKEIWEEILSWLNLRDKAHPSRVSFAWYVYVQGSAVSELAIPFYGNRFGGDRYLLPVREVKTKKGDLTQPSVREFYQQIQTILSLPHYSHLRKKRSSRRLPYNPIMLERLDTLEWWFLLLAILVSTIMVFDMQLPKDHGILTTSQRFFCLLSLPIMAFLPGMCKRMFDPADGGPPEINVFLRQNSSHSLEQRLMSRRERKPPDPVGTLSSHPKQL